MMQEKPVKSNVCLRLEEKETPPVTSQRLDFVLSLVGEFGKWQALVTFLLSLIKLPVAWFQLGIVFLAPPPTSPPTCARPAGSNISLELWRNISHLKPIKGNSLMYESCVIYDLNYTEIAANGWNQTLISSNLSVIKPCHSWEYDRTVFDETIITEWDLICDRTQLSNVVQMTFMLGVLIGNVAFGIWADRVGRKRSLFFAAALQSVTALAAAVCPWFEGFLVLRFLLAISTGGTMITSFVMCMEIVGGWWRTAIPILYQIPFGIGQIIMASLAYFIRDWRNLQITVAFLSSLFVACWWVIPESPRWLLAVGRRKSAMQILKVAAIKNGRSVQPLQDLRLEDQIEKGSQINRGTECRKTGVTELFRNPSLRLITISVFINWLVGGLSFFGFSQYLAYIGGSLFINIAVSAALGVPGTLACIYIIQRFGRKKTLIVAQILTGIATLLILLFPKGVYVGDWPRVALAVVGVIAMSVSFPTIYLYSGELFPTVVRNSAMGIASMFARLGSMAAPFIATLGIYGDYLPPLIFGGIPIAGTVLLLFLPETNGKQLPDSIQDVERNIKRTSTVQDKENPIYIHILEEKEDGKQCRG